MKALVTIDRYFAEEDVKILEDMGIDVDCIYVEKPEFVKNPEQYDIIIAGLLLKYIPIETFPNLKYFQIMTAGFDYLNPKLEYIKEKGIIWHRAEGIHGAVIAEHAIGGLLDIYRQRRIFEEAQKNHFWTHEIPESKNECFYECTGRKALIVGAGKIGSGIAKRLAAFDCHVVGIARSSGPRDWYEAVYSAEYLDRELQDADIVVLAMPNNDETYHILSEERINLMKDDAVLINIARGSLVDEKALIRALQKGKFKGCVLDVFEQEPLPEDSPLWDMKNVVISGHLAGRGDRKKDRFMHFMEKNLQEFINNYKES